MRKLLIAIVIVLCVGGYGVFNLLKHTFIFSNEYNFTNQKGINFNIDYYCGCFLYIKDNLKVDKLQIQKIIDDSFVTAYESFSETEVATEESRRKVLVDTIYKELITLGELYIFILDGNIVRMFPSGNIDNISFRFEIEMEKKK